MSWREKKEGTQYVCKNSVADPEWFIPDPDPALNFWSSRSRFGSGSNPFYLSIFGEKNRKKHTVNSIENKNQLPAISFFAVSGPVTIIPDPDPGKSSGSKRIRIRNNGKNS